MLKLKSKRKDYETTNSVGTGYMLAEDANGSVCLVSQPKVLVCAGSGDYLTDKDVDEHGKLLTDGQGCCYSKKFWDSHSLECDHCHKLGLDFNGIFTEDDKFFCEDCFEKAAYQCDSCLCWYSKEYFQQRGLTGKVEDFWEGVTEVHYCERCADKYFVCDECGYVKDAESCHTTEKGNICDDCYWTLLQRE